MKSPGAGAELQFTEVSGRERARENISKTNSWDNPRFSDLTLYSICCSVGVSVDLLLQRASATSHSHLQNVPERDTKR